MACDSRQDVVVFVQSVLSIGSYLVLLVTAFGLVGGQVESVTFFSSYLNNKNRNGHSCSYCRTLL